MYEYLTDNQKDWIHRHRDDPDAQEKLKAEFYGVATGKQYRELVAYLELDRAISHAFVLAEDIASISDYYHKFSGAILDIEELLKTEVNHSVAHCFFRLLYVNVITALETYLSDVFIGTVKKNPDLMRRFIETTPEFKQEKIPLSDAFEAKNKAEKKAYLYLTDLVWHKVDRVMQMYKNTLGIDFPEDISAISRAIDKRHDIVHRNGKTKEGEEIIITENHISELITPIEECVRIIDTQLSNLQLNTHTSNKDNGL